MRDREKERKRRREWMRMKRRTDPEWHKREREYKNAWEQRWRITTAVGMVNEVRKSASRRRPV